MLIDLLNVLKFMRKYPFETTFCKSSSSPVELLNVQFEDPQNRIA